VQEPGTTMTFAEPLERILEHTPDDALQLSFHEWHFRLDIEGEKHRHSLSSRVEYSPRLELLAESDAPWYCFDASHFCQGLKRVLFAVPHVTDQEKSKRPFLYGVLFHRHEGQDRMVATDGRRLTASILVSQGQPANTEGKFPMRVMLYPACIKFIDVIKSLNAQTCHLRFGEKHLSFECEGVSLRCLWPEGDFPDYLNILPEPKPPLRVQVNREVLVWALEVVSASQQKTVHMTEFRVEAGQMILETNYPEIGRSRVQIPVQYDGPATSASFDAQFIKEGVTQTDATKVTFCFRQQEERLQSMVIELGAGFDYLIMPMRR
jgi:DNA polymerase III sliding clamp (beta) subunit (PCNA family)